MRPHSSDSPGSAAAGCHTSRSEEETIAIARRLAATLRGGAVVLLFGDLGAGKTTFVRGVVEAVGGSSDDVSSPTFTLVQPYAGDLTVQHVDLYRLTSAEADDLGLPELAAPDTIVVIEWADRLHRQPADAVRVWLDDRGGDEREVRIELPAAPGSAAESYSLR